MLQMSQILIPENLCSTESQILHIYGKRVLPGRSSMPKSRRIWKMHRSAGDGSATWDLCKFTHSNRAHGRNISRRAFRLRPFSPLLDSPGKHISTQLPALARAGITPRTRHVQCFGRWKSRQRDIHQRLVPKSASRLSLVSRGSNHHEKALEVIFRNFAAKKVEQLPELRQIHLTCSTSNPVADDAYKKEWTSFRETWRGREWHSANQLVSAL